MALKSLNLFLKPRLVLVWARNCWLRYVGGIDLDLGVRLSLSGRVRSHRRGSIMVGRDTLIAFKTLIYSRDPLTGEDRPVRIGSRCFIGGGSMILPGVTIGDGCIVGAGSVVFDDAPTGSIVAGNPARVLKPDIVVGPFGRLPEADDNARRLWNVDEAPAARN